MITLGDAKGRVRIREIIGEKDFVRRLADMGLAPGQIVEVLSQGNAVVLRVRDAKIALGKGIAKRVVVEVEDEHG
ncbi:MAG: ferrous iron transport protein A [Archaeoglobaceae archaeon]|nr:ferrous iron transport protein A [Archaeoglobaceae archaeon]MDW8127696.1 FeoA family protein [Archaeoglobaceae archaeon]